jgi:DNA polymerase III delta prime subunit
MERAFRVRFTAFDLLFDWFFNSDEPRLFLWGKGGSGKTSIAYEFARVIRRYGRGLRMFDGSTIDNVIFLTAKERRLDPTEGEQRAVDPDFSDERSLYIKLLEYGGWTSDQEALRGADLKELREELQEFFDLTSNMIVIDDIDTLTTKGIEPGIDQLYKLLARSKAHSKLLYTLRSVPLRSISNSIEVPGLAKGREYEEFVAQCAEQYGVPTPINAFRDKALDQASERRPLVIEYIIALRRTSGTYENAVKLFEGDTGEDIRDYVFKREWTALADGTISRSLLCSFGSFGSPGRFWRS